MGNHLDSCRFNGCTGCAPNPNAREVLKLKREIERLKKQLFDCGECRGCRGGAGCPPHTCRISHE